MKKMMYPDWYFKYYDNVFKRDTYSREISLINCVSSIKNKIVLEIGSGKGYHAEEIIKLNPQNLKLIDYQKEAYNILKNRFKNNSDIDLIFADAFNISLNNKVDIALIFYSVLPQVSTKKMLKDRIRHIFDNLIKPNGLLAFEYIDYEKSSEVFPESHQSLIFQNKEIELFIKSSYSSDMIHIKYFGTFQSEQLIYEVDLLKLNKTIIREIAKELKLEQFDNISLDNDERRKMTFLRRPATNKGYTQ